MLMAKKDIIRLIYSIFLSLFIIAVGITLIAVAADIYYSGKGTGVIYSREIVGERLLTLSIPLVLLIAAIIAGAVFPLIEKKPDRNKGSALKKLSKRIPEGESEEYKKAQAEYNKAGKIRLIIWLCVLAVLLATTIASLVYLCTAANFRGEDFNAEILKMVAHILPCVAVSIVAGAGVSIYNGVLVEKQLKAAKAMIVAGNGPVKGEPDYYKKLEAVKAIAASKITIWVIRGVIFALAVTFILLGIFNGGANDVLNKAINICTECIGLG